MMLLKHVRNWSYGGMEAEVRANLVYRSFFLPDRDGKKYTGCQDAGKSAGLGADVMRMHAPDW